jgi:hypothetical protein
MISDLWNVCFLKSYILMAHEVNNVPALNILSVSESRLFTIMWVSFFYFHRLVIEGNSDFVKGSPWRYKEPSWSHRVSPSGGSAHPEVVDVYPDVLELYPGS